MLTVCAANVGYRGKIITNWKT